MQAGLTNEAIGLIEWLQLLQTGFKCHIYGFIRDIIPSFLPLFVLF